MEKEQEILRAETESGEVLSLIVEEYFFFEGNRYALLTEKDAGTDDAFIMSVTETMTEEGEEVFESVTPEEAERIYQAVFVDPQDE